jgi:hypothetical protein
MLAEQLAKAWILRREAGVIDPRMRFSREGLLLGAGTVLAPAGASDGGIPTGELEPRLTTLLVAAHQRLPEVGALAHLRKAVECWNLGRDTLSAMHLAISGVDRLSEPVSDAHRLFLADSLLSSGIDAVTIIAAIDHIKRLEKYNSNQPRVPAGNGRASGEWTDGSGGPATSRPLSSPRPKRSKPRPTNSPKSTNPRSILARPQREAEEPQAATLWPRTGVTASTITHITQPISGIDQPYWGPDACLRAKLDCYRNTIEEAESHGAANSNWTRWQREEFLRCSLAEDACVLLGSVVERTPFMQRSAVRYPDGGVVISQKGWEDDLYIPAPARGRIPPMRRSL